MPGIPAEKVLILGYDERESSTTEICNYPRHLDMADAFAGIG